jgi:YfiH family protein
VKIPGILATFTDRRGGVSAAPYASCNLGLHVGDDPACVIENRERVAKRIGIPLDAWVAGEQVHGATVTVVNNQMRGRGSRDIETLLPATDALITDVEGIALTTYAADCVPVLLADPNRRAVGVAHAGWKGTVAKIVLKTVEALHETYGCDPSDVRAVIGPSIGPCCYEVDERVAAHVRQAFPNVYERLLIPNGHGRWQFDLWQANVEALLEAGVLLEHIEREDRCTACEVETFFSYRKEGGKTGHAGIIALLQENGGS